MELEPFQQAFLGALFGFVIGIVVAIQVAKDVAMYTMKKAMSDQPIIVTNDAGHGVLSITVGEVELLQAYYGDEVPPSFLRYDYRRADEQ